MYIYLFISRNETKILVNHKIKHFLFFGGSGGSSAARIASSNTFFNPFCVSAEHSTYLTARSSLANFSPTSWVNGLCLFFASFSIVAASSLRSICVPTNKKGVFWQWWVISGTHFSLTFSKDDGETTEKQTRKTSVWKEDEWLLLLYSINLYEQKVIIFVTLLDNMIKN